MSSAADLAADLRRQAQEIEAEAATRADELRRLAASLDGRLDDVEHAPAPRPGERLRVAKSDLLTIQQAADILGMCDKKASELGSIAGARTTLLGKVYLKESVLVEHLGHPLKRNERAAPHSEICREIPNSSVAPAAPVGDDSPKRKRVRKKGANDGRR